MKEKMLDHILHHREKALKYLVTGLLILIALFIFLGKDGQEELVIEGRGTPSPEEQQAVREEAQEEDLESREIFIHLSGAVKNPGVLKLPEGTRVYEALEMAGGLGPEADSSGINLARTLRDEEQIHIPREGEALTSSVLYSQAPMQPMGGEAGPKGLVNINTADSETLQTLTGIGPSIAGKILDYRQSSGPFRSIEQIKEVHGIGDKTFEKFKDKICI